MVPGYQPAQSLSAAQRDEQRRMMVEQIEALSRAVNLQGRAIVTLRVDALDSANALSAVLARLIATETSVDALRQRPLTRWGRIVRRVRG